jgi:hypothetical protein
VDVLSFLEGDQRDGVVVASGVVVEVECLAGREEGLGRVRREGGGRREKKEEGGVSS